MGHKWPVLRPRCVGSGRARTQILFYSILFYSILFCSILFCSILFYSVLFFSFIFCSILFCSILFYSILCYSILFYSFLFFSILFYSQVCTINVPHPMSCRILSQLIFPKKKHRLADTLSQSTGCPFYPVF